MATAFLSSGGALSTAKGFGNKTLELRGGNGGYHVTSCGLDIELPATAGTGHDYVNGGAAGAGTGAAAGGNGNPPSPSTMAYPGTAGGGGARNDGGSRGYPGAPGGGGGSFNIFGSAGNGGNGSGSAIGITSYR